MNNILIIVNLSLTQANKVKIFMKYFKNIQKLILKSSLIVIQKKNHQCLALCRLFIFMKKNMLSR